MSEALVLLAHGSPDPRHGEDVRAAATRLREPWGGPVLVAYLDHQAPTLAEAVRTLPHGSGVRVVPLLLATGFHARTDVPAALEAARGARPDVAVAAAGALGPHPLIEQALAQRLAEAGAPDGVTAAPLLARGVLHDRAVAEGPAWTPAPLLGTAALDDLIVQRAMGARPA